MSTTHPQDKTTEWEALQIKHGNFAPKQKEITEEELTSIAVDFAETYDPLDNKDLDELNKLEDDVEEDILEVYRRKRRAELQAKAKAFRFGDLGHITRADYQVEVTDESKNGTWVVLHLYKDSMIECKKLNSIFSTLAKKFGQVKFLKGISTDIIENYPDAKVPTVLLYHNGKCRRVVYGVSGWCGPDVKSAEALTLERVELTLSKFKVVESDLVDEEELTESQTRSRGTTQRFAARELYGRPDEEDDEDDDDTLKDDREYSSLKMGHLKM